MGNAASKATASTARKLPVNNAAKRLRQHASPPPVGAASQQTVAPSPLNEKIAASSTKSEAIIKDSQDPHFSSMLRSLGSVSHGNAPHPPSPSSPGLQPPQFSIPPVQKPTSTSNGRSSPSSSSSQKISSRFAPRVPDSVRILQAREILNKAMGESPDEYLDVFRIRDVVMMREGGSAWGRRKMSDDEIERTLNLKEGILERLGDRVGHKGVQIKEEKGEVDFVRAYI